MNWGDLEALYWRFDAMHNGYGEWAGMPTSERDAFKHTVKQALAEKDQQIERWKNLSRDEHVRLLAESKEHLLQQYVNLTQMYGEQKHEIRRLTSAIAEKDREITNLQTCQCEGCDESLEGEAYCQSCWMKLREAHHALMGQAVRFAERLIMYQDSNVLLMRHRDVDEFIASPEVREWREQEGEHAE
jgi:hypothetical protein